MNSTPSWDEVVSHHEAGHAVVHLYFGDEIDSVTIEPDGDTGGAVVVDRGNHEALRYQDETVKQVPFERAIIASLAGEVAQRRFAPESVDDHHAGGDRLLAHDYLDELDCPTQEIRDAYWRLLELRTEALIDQLWPSVQSVARALVQHRSLTPEQATAAFQAGFNEGERAA